MSLEIPYSIQLINPQPVDYYYGPWPDVATALANVPLAVRTLGLQVYITSLNARYIWKESTADSGLVPDGSNIAIDAKPTIASTNAVSSGGTYFELYGYTPAIQDSQGNLVVTFDATLIVTLTKNITLSVADTTPGKKGTVIVVQDTVGYHTVQFAAGNTGLTENLLLQPGSKTRFDWLNDASGTTWTSFPGTPQIMINNPAQINNLAVITIDSIGSTISWTAPNGNPVGLVPVPVDRYHIYISNAPITSGSATTGLNEYYQTIVPQSPGATESIRLINGLSPNTQYYVCITADKTIYGTLRTSAISNVVNFYTLAIAQNVITPVQIPINGKESYLGDSFYYNVESGETTFDFSNTLLDDVSNATNYANVNSSVIPLEGTPGTGNGIFIQSYNYKFQGTYNVPFIPIIIPLDNTYEIDLIYILLQSGNTGNLNLGISTSSDGYNWNTLATYGTYNGDYEGGNTCKWGTLTPVSGGQYGVKYIRLELGGYYSVISGIAFFGRQTAASSIVGTKYKRYSAPKPFNLMAGTNSISTYEDLPNLAQVGTYNRHYYNWYWMWQYPTTTIDPYTHSYYANVHQNGDNPPITGLNFCFSTQTQQMDQNLAIIAGLGLKVHLCLVDMIQWLAPNGDPNNELEMPLDPGINRQLLSNTLNPLNYTYFARCVYNIVARYGGNTAANTSYISLNTGETVQVGLNYIASWEFGNEIDRAYNGTFHITPAEMACLYHVAKDGAKGTLGAGMGMIAADPNAFLVMSGLETPNLGNIKAMCTWWDNVRGKGDYPIDAINLHYYNTFGTSVQNNIDVTARAVQPEWAGLESLVKEFVAFRDEFMPNVEFWITETGYNELNGSPTSPSMTDQVTRAVTKGQWIIRTLVLIQAWGADRVMQYFFRNQYANDVLNNTENAVDDQNGDIFLTTGYMCPEFSGADFFTNSIPNMAWWYMTAFRNAMTGYTLKFLMMEHGVAVSTNSPFPVYDQDIYAVAYQYTDGSYAILAWLAPIANAALLTEQRSLVTQINVLLTELNVTVIDFENSHVTQTKQGNTSTIASVNTNGVAAITITLTETPKLIKTNNIGNVQMIPCAIPILTALSTTSVQITWTDVNIGANTTKIFQSSSNAGPFTLINNSYIDNGSYIVNGLTPGAGYYFEVAFVSADGIIQSAMSPIANIQMPITIPVPSNFLAGGPTPTSITLTWQYSTQNQALITGYELWRSTSATGTYVQLPVTLAPSQLSYTDNGLISSSNYYYKLMAYTPHQQSLFTASTGTTTLAPNLSPPAIILAATNYTGDLLLLQISLGINTPTGTANQNAFTVSQNVSGVITVITVTAITLAPGDNTKIYLYLASAIPAAATIKIAYDSTIGNIESTVSVAMSSVTNYSVLNYIGSSTLLINKYQIYFTTAVDGNNPTGWYNMINTAAPQMYDNVTDYNGNVSTMRLLHAYNYSGNYYDGMAVYGIPSPLTTDPINSTFPADVRQNAIQMPASNTGLVKGAFVLLNPNTSHFFNFKCYITNRNAHSSPATDVTFDILGTTESETITTGNDVFPEIYLTNVIPNSPTITPLLNVYNPNQAYLDQTGTQSNIPYLSNPLIVLEFQSVTNGNYGYFTAMIVEEVVLPSNNLSIENNGESPVTVTMLGADSITYTYGPVAPGNSVAAIIPVQNYSNLEYFVGGSNPATISFNGATGDTVQAQQTYSFGAFETTDIPLTLTIT